MNAKAALIMVVDDEPLVRSLLSERLDHEGYAVVEAGNADQAIEIMEQCGVNAVISDVQMPGAMDGVGLALWIAKNAPLVPVLLISGRARADKLRPLPAIPFFQKPFRLSEILAELRSRVGRNASCLRVKPV